ncbi:hypothetical protein EX30DRAFT_131085 [Ascodesmis nigricans]|uniref:Uncharacterized protein n=1 Tax=Ascodesmis nigricans TaxID=341454 RepID=A0A4S2MNM6_9PEZI|nr:hypothetical protein EX30DRAFT_131085 [Ascodesmis nigricans]
MPCHIQMSMAMAIAMGAALNRRQRNHYLNLPQRGLIQQLRFEYEVIGGQGGLSEGVGLEVMRTKRREERGGGVMWVSDRLTMYGIRMGVPWGTRVCYGWRRWEELWDDSMMLLYLLLVLSGSNDAHDDLESRWRFGVGCLSEWGRCFVVFCRDNGGEKVTSSDLGLD